MDMTHNAVINYINLYENIVNENEKMFTKHFLSRFNVMYILKVMFSSRYLYVTFLTDSGEHNIYEIPFFDFIDWFQEISAYD